MRLPSFECYCANTTAVNALVFDLGGARVWFSYQTPVAFQRAGGPIIVRENAWGPTTGKHLNAIDGGDRQARKDRLGGEAFELALSNLLEGAPCP